MEQQRQDYFRTGTMKQRTGMQEAEKPNMRLISPGKEQVKQHRLKELDKSKYTDFTAVKK